MARARSRVPIARGLRPPFLAAGGFTLIELLVVMVIMALFMGLVAAVVQPDARGLLRVEADRLAQLLELAAEEARLTGRTIVWAAEGPGYRFWRLNGEAGWIDISDSDVLRARTLPPGMVVSALVVEGTPAQGEIRLAFGPDNPAFAYRIELSLDAARSSVTASPIGELQVVPGGGLDDAALARQ